MVGMLWFDGQGPIKCRSAMLTVTAKVDRYEDFKRIDEPDAPDVTYSLSVIVDGSSGEDGAAAPDAVLPVLDATGGRHPSLWELGSLHLTGQDDETWDDAWFGNDAPALAENDLQFLGWNGTALRLRWMAVNDARGRALAYHDPDGNMPEPSLLGTFRFEGEVGFEAVSCYVQSVADADRAVVAVWGARFLDGVARDVRPTFPIPGSDPVQYESMLVTYRLTQPPAAP